MKASTVVMMAMPVLTGVFIMKVDYPGKFKAEYARETFMDNHEVFYEGASAWDAGAQPAHDAANNRDAAERYFTLITDFFEYGWGDAFHMSPLKKGYSFKHSMAYWENNFALEMGIQPGMRVADLGMGIGGPLRRIAEFTGANMTGLTNCNYQVNRARTITSKLTSSWHKDRCHYVVGDYNSLPSEFEDNSFDAVYFMESLSHAEDRAPPLAEALRIVKPGGIVAAWQWMLRPQFNYSDSYHMELKRGMEYGGGLRNLNKPEERHVEYERAGLEVLRSWDMGMQALERGWNGWWTSLTSGHDIPSMLTSSHFGRRLTMWTVWVLETIGVAEKGTLRTAEMLEHCGWSAAKAGEMHIFTPAWVTISRAPLDKNTKRKA
jgi:sterol 24-C-methyltransferase